MSRATDLLLASWRKHWRVNGVALSVIAALSAAAYIAQIAPALAERADADSAVGQMAAERVHIGQLNSELTKVREQTQAIRKPANGVAPTFDSEANMNDRLAKLTDLASAAGVQVDDMEPTGGSVSGPCFTVIGIRLTGKCGYRNCQRLLRSLHDKMPDVMVASVQLSASGTANPNDSSISLQLNWYAQGADGGKTP